LAITDYSMPELIRLIRWIESDTLPRTEDELVREAADQLGFQRVGSRIRDALLRAIHAGRRGANARSGGSTLS
jgi:hypothetical protein